jgi:hypothetical protein
MATSLDGLGLLANSFSSLARSGSRPAGVEDGVETVGQSDLNGLVG